MSTLTVTNIQATGETASRAVSGVAAAWVNMNGTGTIAARDSINVASLTDNSTGNYTINFSSAMANVNYCPSGITQGGGTNSSFTNIAGGGGDSIVLTTSAAPMRVTSPGTGQVDVTVCTYEFNGDLA